MLWGITTEQVVVKLNRTGCGEQELNMLWSPRIKQGPRIKQDLINKN